MDVREKRRQPITSMRSKVLQAFSVDAINSCSFPYFGGGEVCINVSSGAGAESGDVGGDDEKVSERFFQTSCRASFVEATLELRCSKILHEVKYN